MKNHQIMPVQAGSEYQDILSPARLSAATTPQVWCQNTVAAYQARYDGGNDNQTYVACRLSEVNNLSTRVSDLATMLINNIATERANISGAWSSSRRYTDDGLYVNNVYRSFVDLHDFCSNLRQRTTDATIANQCLLVMSTVANDMVISYWADAQYTGTTAGQRCFWIYFPSSTAELGWNNYNGGFLPFLASAQQHWDEFLRCYFDTTTPPAPSVSSSTHPDQNAWYTSTSPMFSWSTPSDDSGINGYSYSWDASSSTTPDSVVDATGNSVSYSGWPAGVWYFHVRAMDNAGNWGPAAHFRAKIDNQAPAAPVVSSSTHPDQNTWYASGSPALAWTTPSDTSGISGYSYALDTSSTTTPDTAIDTTGNAASSSGLSSGIWYFHVRACDNAGNWGSAGHYRLRIDHDGPVSGTIAINGGASETGSLIVELDSLGATDSASGLSQMRFSNDGATWSPAEAYASVRAGWNLSAYGGNANSGTKTVSVQYGDVAGNWSGGFADTIVYNPTVPPPGMLQFASSAYSVNENGGSVRIYVSRTAGSHGPASVICSTANGTATAPSDYTAASGTLSWADGETANKPFDVLITDGNIYEGIETFTAGLSGATGASLGSPTLTTVTIVDNDPLPTACFRAPRRLTNGVVELLLDCAPGCSYWIQCSTNLVSWRAIFSASPSSTTMAFSDTNVIGLRSCYYRALGFSATNTTPHPADLNADFTVTGSELAAYAAWYINGGPWPIPPSPIPATYYTNATLIWHTGDQSYHCNPALPPPDCWVPGR